MSNRKNGFGAEKPGSGGRDQDPLRMERLAEEIAEKAKREARAHHPDLSLTDEEAMAAGLLILVGKAFRKTILETFEAAWEQRKEEHGRQK